MSNHTGFQNRGPDKASPERQGDVGWGVGGERHLRRARTLSAILLSVSSKPEKKAPPRTTLSERLRGLTYGTRGWR